jgi:hypothetical protein
MEERTREGELAALGRARRAEVGGQVLARQQAAEHTRAGLGDLLHGEERLRALAVRHQAGLTLRQAKAAFLGGHCLVEHDDIVGPAHLRQQHHGRAAGHGRGEVLAPALPEGIDAHRRHQPGRAPGLEEPRRSGTRGRASRRRREVLQLEDGDIGAAFRHGGQRALFGAADKEPGAAKGERKRHGGEAKPARRRL